MNYSMLKNMSVPLSVRDIRSGHYKRSFHTTTVEVELKSFKLKGIPFEVAIIERYHRI